MEGEGEGGGAGVGRPFGVEAVATVLHPPRGPDTETATHGAAERNREGEERNRDFAMPLRLARSRQRG